MRFSLRNLRQVLSGTGVLAALAAAGCGNSCFVAVSNNGNGTLFIAVANPPPTCSLSMGMGTMHMVLTRTPACATCPAATRLEHVFVTVRSIRLRPSDPDEGSSSEGFELAPQFRSAPRQFDLIGDSREWLVGNVSVPAGSYRDVRLEFAPDSDRPAEQLSGSGCRAMQADCAIRGDGRVESLGFPNPPELVIPFEGDAVAVLPDTRLELRLGLRPQTVFVSSGDGWATTLVGNAEIKRQ
jgi:hypothetical protein